jgi:hypothetical protein
MPQNYVTEALIVCGREDYDHNTKNYIMFIDSSKILYGAVVVVIVW